MRTNARSSSGRSPASGSPRKPVEETPAQGRSKWEIQQSFDLDAFLGQSLVARVATVGGTGPTVWPLWYLWEEHAFWWLTGGWPKLGQLLERDPRVALVADTCDLWRGEVLQLTEGAGVLRSSRSTPTARARDVVTSAPTNAIGVVSRSGVFDGPTTRFAVWDATTLRVRDLSY